MKAKLMFTQKLFSLLLSFCILQSCTQKSKDYPTIFGNRYSEAVSYFQKNSWIADTIVNYSVDTNLAISIVFPEVIRYSSLKDIAETHSLEVLYAQYGTNYADFSIGRFQIKPSFAYQLEKDWTKYLKKDLKPFIKPFDTLDNPSLRLERIYRLKDDKWQVKYLIMFYKLMEDRFDKKWGNDEQKVTLFASAYNKGYWFDFRTIQSSGSINYYHTGILNPKVCFNYSDISLYYYRKTKMPK